MPSRPTCVGPFSTLSSTGQGFLASRRDSRAPPTRSRRYRLRGVGALGVHHKLGGIAITLGFDLCVKIDFSWGNTTCASPSVMRTVTDFQRTAATATGRKPEIGSAIFRFRK